MTPSAAAIAEAQAHLTNAGMGPILTQPDVLRACSILRHPELVHEITERGVGASIWAAL